MSYETMSTLEVPSEKSAVFSIAAIYALRLLGLFMLVPILSLYAHTLKNATPLLIGLALGCYGLTQALFQIPFGMLSDRFGRKSLIAWGLILFALGSIVAALSHNIWGLILGRSLQGAGAVGSVTVALLADLTPETQRTKAMAIIGMTIGAAFSIAMILGPLLNSWFSVPSIFWITLLLGLSALFVLLFWVPEPTKISPQKNDTTNLRAILTNPNLLYFNFGILFLHAILTANFVVLPFILLHNMGIHIDQHWKIYLPALLLAFITILPVMRWLRSQKNNQRIYLLAIVLLLLAEILFWQLQTYGWEAILSLWIFFTAFTLLEAIIPSSISQIAPIESRGTAMGVNSTLQFFGIFLGGTFAGWFLDHFQIDGVLIACSLLAFLWVSWALWKQRTNF